MMGWRGTGVLALLVVGLAVYVWFEEVPETVPTRSADFGDRQHDPNPTPSRRLLEIDPAVVTGIRVQFAGEARHARRTGSAWVGVTPPAAIADFLGALAGLGVLGEMSSAPDTLAQYGLDAPRMIVELEPQDGGTPIVLRVGERNPPGTAVYVQLGESGPVVLVGALLAWEVEKAFRAMPPAPGAS
jgi:hypothetical protein